MFVFLRLTMILEGRNFNIYKTNISKNICL